MSTVDAVFVGTDEPIEEVARDLGHALHGSFERGPDGDLLLVRDRTALNLDTHDFVDDRDMPFSQYPYWLEVRDFDRDDERQSKTAGKAFDAARRIGRWRLMLVHDLQHRVGSYEPSRHARAS